MADIRFLQVDINGLKIRTTPGDNSVGAHLKRGEVIKVDYDKRVEKHGYIWVRHYEGWSAIRPITLRDGERAYVQDITHLVPATGVIFKVRYTSLHVRPTPTSPPNEYILVYDDVVIAEKAPGGQPRDGGHIWWKHPLGWTSERHGATLYMVKVDDIDNPRADLTAPPEPLINPLSITPGSPTPPDEPPDTPAIPITHYYQVVASDGINIRSHHDASSERVGFADYGDMLTIKATFPQVHGNYRWLELTSGSWVAMGPKDTAVDWLERIEKPAQFEPVFLSPSTIHEIPSWRNLFSDFPVTFPAERDWFQYFGNTVFAFTDGTKYNYDGYSQGLHGGLDFGSSAVSLDVYARVTGEVVLIIDQAGARNQVHVQSGPYLIIYQHLENHNHPDLIKHGDLPEVGQAVTPDTFLGKTMFGSGKPNHLHFEVRYKEKMIINPLELMPQSMTDKILARYNPDAPSGSANSLLRRFYKSVQWHQWTAPFDQPIIQLRGKVIGPKTLVR